MKNFLGSRSIPDIVYHSPEDMDGLMSLLKDGMGNSMIVAGCTDFIPAVRSGRWTFDDGINIIDIRKIKTLEYVRREDGMLKIGACTRLTHILESPEVIENAPVLAEAVGQIGSLQVRNTATIGGNICMSSPAADTVPPLLVLEAKIALRDPDGEEEIVLNDFFTGPGQNVLKPNQVLTEISFPIVGNEAAAHFLKIGKRTAVIISVVSAAVYLSVKNGVCKNPRIALGSVAPTPLRMARAEAFLDNKELDDKIIEQCAGMASEEVSPITDLRGSREYRKDMVRTLVRRAIVACREEQV